MESITAREFWNSIDNRLDACGENLTSLSEKTGIKYKTLSMQRNRHSLPGIEQLTAMANFFHISLDELIMGKNVEKVIQSEAEAVMNDERLRVLVNYLICNPETIDKLLVLFDLIPDKRDTSRLA